MKYSIIIFMKRSEFCIVITTTDDQEHARFLARSLLDARLAACVQIEPIESLYRWEGTIQSAREYRLQIKTLRALYEKIESMILTQHPYETPEILLLPTEGGLERYLEWIRTECPLD